MKLLVAGMVGVLVSVAALTGCGPGLSHREAAKAPMTPDSPDLLATLNAELAQTIIGTTTTTSAESMPLPASRMATAAVKDPVAPVTPTWGAGGEAIAAEERASANDDFDMHPYDRGSFDQHPYE